MLYEILLQQNIQRDIQNLEEQEDVSTVLGSKFLCERLQIEKESERKGLRAL